jgi:hypothetical protein
MAYLNNVMIIRHELMARLVKMFREEKLAATIDALPVELNPKGRKTRSRCCIYKERAITRYKILPLLGFEVPEDDIDLHTLRDYANAALEREKPDDRILTVVDEACNGCVQVNYVVTNLCRGCVASPCVAKRKEARDLGTVDYVLSFEELDAMMTGMGILPDQMEEMTLENYTKESRGFAQSGGVLAAVLAERKIETFSAEKIDGIDRKTIRTLKKMEKGKTDAQFYEVMSCEGGCISGPYAYIKSAKAKENFINSLKSLPSS